MMRPLKRILALLLIFCGGVLPLGNEGYARKYVEKYKIDVSRGEHAVDHDETLTVKDETMYAARRSFGLLAGDVKYFKTAYNNVLITQNSKGNVVYQIDLLRKNKSGEIRYKKYRVTDDAKNIYPIGDSAMFYRNQKNQIGYTGVGTCDLMFSHDDAETCERECEHQVRNQVVLEHVKKCWGDTELFAYVKGNRLFITGQALRFDVRDRKNPRECYKRETVKGYFEGRGNEVKQVVYGYDREALIFVLLKDGSVWGMGQNEAYSLTNEYAASWVGRPLKLMSNVKHVYGNKNMTFVLTKNSNLYWRGEQGITYSYWW